LGCSRVHPRDCIFPVKVIVSDGRSSTGLASSIGVGPHLPPLSSITRTLLPGLGQSPPHLKAALSRTCSKGSLLCALATLSSFFHFLLTFLSILRSAWVFPLIFGLKAGLMDEILAASEA
jgi:hypothetical protein